MKASELKAKEGTGSEVFSVGEDGVKEDAAFHDRMEQGSPRGRMLADLIAAEQAVAAGVSPEVAWKLCAGPELRAMG